MKSVERMKNYFEKHTRTKNFIDGILRIRQEIGLPKNGIACPKNLFDDIEELVGMVIGVSYKGKFYPTTFGRLLPLFLDILKPIPVLYRDTSGTFLFLNAYILYNERFYDFFDNKAGIFSDAVASINFRSEYLEMEGCCDCELKVCEGFMDTVSKRYPVILGISPYATQNEVIDLVKNRWEDIQQEMKCLELNGHIDHFAKEKSHLAKVRKRKMQSKQIEDIVYENRRKNLKEIAHTVRKETGIFLDVGEIGKIRSLAKKRRDGK